MFKTILKIVLKTLKIGNPAGKIQTWKYHSQNINDKAHILKENNLKIVITCLLNYGNWFGALTLQALKTSSFMSITSYLEQFI